MGLSALIIDDDTNNIEVLASLLSLENIDSTTLSDPRKVEQTLSETARPDVVFLDLHMADLSGYDVLTILRSQLDPSVPIVAYTVHTNEIKVARQMGFHSLLAKPLDADRFPATLKRILKGESVWQVG